VDAVSDSTELITIDDIAGPDVAETDTLLALAGKTGETILYRLSSGWRCSIELPTVLAGAQFKVGSEFGHPTARSAIIECLARVKEALKK
jgi:hypothetical protein